MQLKLQHNGVSRNTKQKEFNFKNKGTNPMSKAHDFKYRARVIKCGSH